MATVYLATDLKHQRSVAIKVLLPELTASVGHDRFLQEIGIASALPQAVSSGSSPRRWSDLSSIV